MDEAVGSRHRVHGPGVAHEIVDGEVVIINLVTGDYYSCRGVAADAWRALVDGATAGEIADAIGQAYEVGDADVAGEVASFAAALVGEELLARTDGGGPVTPALAGSGPYAPPEFEKFSDMADLIVLDPVHDVSDAGWPHAPGTG